MDQYLGSYQVSVTLRYDSVGQYLGCYHVGVSTRTGLWGSIPGMLLCGCEHLDMILWNQYLESYKVSA